MGGYFTTKNDCPVFAGSVENSRELVVAGREWACKAYCVAACLDQLSARVIARVTDHVTDQVTWQDYTHAQNVLRQRTEDTVRLKALLVSAIQR